MATITIQELRRSLAAVLKRVHQGEWITVLRRGKPVARLGPPEEHGLHVGKLCGTGYRIEPVGHRLTKGAYLSVLLDDRGGEKA
ncbi:MAG: type II toxin-antitoxin system prevent-host-death family antitoxin [Planctomycetota bacterium]